MGWVSLLTALLKLGSWVAEIIQTKQLMDAGAAKAIASNLEAQHELLAKAANARAHARADFAANGLPNNDPNRRD